MQDERKPDLAGPDHEALEEKVREMMDPAKDDPKTAGTGKATEAATAPEITELPKAKEPLKIKIIKEDPEESDTTEDKPPKASKKKAEEVPGAPVVSSVETDSPDDEPEEIDPEAETPEEDESEEPEVQEAEQEPEEENDVVPEEQPKEVDLDDTETVEAVDDIVANESDDLLAAEDEKIAAAFQPKAKPTFGSRIKSLLAAWWRNPKARWLTFTFLFLALLATGLVPASRYFILNTAGVRSSTSVQILDASTQQPLKNVKVKVGGAEGLTGSDGRVKLAKVKLGPSSLVIEKRAFAPITQPLTIGWGSNPVGPFKLTPTGTQYSFVLTDYLSGKGIEGVEATSGEANALSDRDGKIKLTLDQPADEFEVSFKADNLREEKVKVNADNKTEQIVQAVPSRKEVFISNRSGKFDVYKIDIDGKNEEKILAGTGSERNDMVLVSHPSEEMAALVSTRDNKRNQDGFLLSTLSLIDLSDNSAQTVVQSERIQIIDWIGDRLIYVQIAQGTSTSNPKRHRLMSYNYKTANNQELASANYFNDVAVVGTKVYYAPSSAYQSGSSGNFYKLDADGSNRQTLLSEETWNFFRTSYDHLTVSASTNNWYDYKVSDKMPSKLQGQPASLVSRIYVDSPDSKRSLWVDNRDGKGVLLAFEPGTQNEQILRTQSGLKNPVRWLTSNVIIYRINTDQETADYTLSLNGGDPKKIRDVTNTDNVDRWYYY